MRVSVSSVHEEAASGAAPFAAYTVGAIEYRDGFGDYIEYMEKGAEQ
jgi:hypothetical protein